MAALHPRGSAGLATVLDDLGQLPHSSNATFSHWWEGPERGSKTRPWLTRTNYALRNLVRHRMEAPRSLRDDQYFEHRGLGPTILPTVGNRIERSWHCGFCARRLTSGGLSVVPREDLAHRLAVDRCISWEGLCQ